ncbi:MAG TPA: PKD domain-containing protein, partial [Pyrinomonadaceae bacterium]|nr:PKD domain-containing protein [Pyrinomonadaceae bacterium]
MKRILTTLLTVSLVVGSIAGLCATPAAARVYSVQPTNEDGGPPTDQFTTADPVFAIFRSDVEGGKICVVPEGEPDNKSHCKTIANFVGTGWSFIARGLPLGRYQLIAYDPDYSFLSVPFEVKDCTAPDCAARRLISDEIVDGWKQAAAEQIGRLDTVGKNIEFGEIGDAFFQARHGCGLIGFDDFIDHRLTGWVADAVFVGGVAGLGFAVYDLSRLDTPTSVDSAFLILAREVTVGTKRMYEDIKKDPPDFDYTTVAAPAFNEWPSTGVAQHDRVVRSLERQRAFGRAQLKAYERYLGAVADGQEVYVRMQAQAVADYGEALAAEMKESAAALRQWGAELDPNVPAVTQEHLDQTVAIYDRVRASGFTPDELNQLTAAGLSAIEIEQVRSAFDEDIRQTPVGLSMHDALAQAADALEAGVPSVLTLSSEVAWVADGRAPKAVSLAPASASLQVGSTHNVSAVVTDARNEPVAGVSVALSVTGANPAVLAAPTGADGVAAFSYVGNNPGDDDLSAKAGTAASNAAAVRWSVGPPNAAPSVRGYNDSIYEGGTGGFEFDFTDADTQDTHTATIDWGDGSPVSTFPDASGKSGVFVDNRGSGLVIGLHHYPESGLYNVTGTVTDSRGGVGTAVLTANVMNVAPALSDVALEMINGEVVVSANFTDPGVEDTHTVVLNWGDGTSSAGTLTEAGGSGSVSGRHAYAKPGQYTITLSVSDDDGGTTSRNIGFTMGDGGLGNSPPSIPPNNYATYEGGGSFSAPFTDPDALDVHTATIDWGDGSPVEALAVQESNGSGLAYGTHDYVDNGNFNVTVKVADNHGGVTTQVSPMTVRNAPPNIFPIFVPNRLQTLGDTIKVSATFNDFGIRDTHTALWDWGDGTTSPADLTETNGSGSAVGSHAYTSTGVYVISLTVTDKDGDVGIMSIFNPIGVYAAKIRSGSIKPVATETGKISTSVSGLGITGRRGMLEVEKPAGALVRRAYLAAATTGFHEYLLKPGDVKLDG